MLERKKGLAVELEATYNTDPTVDPAADAVLTRGLTVQPLDGDFINRDLDRAELGAQGDILVASRVLMGFEVEAAGSGTAGTPPAWEDLLRGVGYGASVNVPATSDTYDLVSSSFSSLWMEANTDGIEHRASGARGNMSFAWTTRDIPRFAFQFQGLYNAPADVPIPSYTTSGFTTPEAFNNANTPTLTLLGQSIPVESISLDLQNQIEHRDIIGSEEILIVDRNVRGQVSFSASLLATYDWFAAVAARTEGALAIVHGDTAGNIVTINAPAVEVSNPQFAESQGDLMLTLDLICKPSAGDDELELVFT